MYILNAISENKQLNFKGDKLKSPEQKHFKSIGEYYKSLGVR